MIDEELLKQLREKKIEQLKRDQDSQWWQAGEDDDFNLKNKLLRVGCRPLKRKYLSCQKERDNDVESYAECKKLRTQLDECYETFQFVQIQKAHEKVDQHLLETTMRNQKLSKDNI
ncbi:UNKNOWN [Stylonychia lemnae]|uniref:Uncharacterized protein n=1 Tax=Stylonychia lemnae TaxID=5949 RepID=A0A078AYI3_STYLE|nr:UNKNOWN [Stylonychia lemnae]|eukprot:CDW86272.1 UNKNOWN [Stylonychia lemnae]